jgi:myo-inositol-1(or 4)-monophosphatase
MTPKEALEVSRAIGDEIRKSIARMAGKGESSIEVGVGKDGTPTKKIDRIAESEALKILEQYDVTVVSEEAGVIGEGETIVALDPIDGTFNATRGIPIYSVSLCFSKSRLLCDTFFGYVMNLATGMEYWADETAYRDGKRIKVSECNSLQCNAVIYYPERRFEVKRIRIFGSAALEICFVADGSFDCFIDFRDVNGRGMLRVYDVAAALHIAKAAGAVVTDTNGRSIERKRFEMDERFKLVVANKALHQKLLEMIG